jgi:hypothetical protein
MGAPDVLATRTVAEGRDAAVSMYLDVSGSMYTTAHTEGREGQPPIYTSRWRITSTAAFWVSMAIQQAGARLWVSFFNSDIYLALEPGERLAPAHLSAFSRDAHTRGGTAGASLLMDALHRLGPERAIRKVCIVMTDGASGEDGPIPRLKRKLDAEGIELAVIGLCCDPTEYKTWPPDVCHAVQDLTTLPRVIGKILAPDERMP